MIKLQSAVSTHLVLDSAANVTSQDLADRERQEKIELLYRAVYYQVQPVKATEQKQITAATKMVP